MIVLIAGITLGVTLYAPLSAQRIGSIPLRFDERIVHHTDRVAHIVDGQLDA